MIKKLTNLIKGQPIEMSAETKALAANHALYHFSSCPFCMIVRRQINKMELPIELRNIHQDATFAQELYSEGGSSQVPCLRITQEDGSYLWMYESRDINSYLMKTFG